MEEVQKLRASLDDHRTRQENIKKSSADRENSFAQQINEMKIAFERNTVGKIIIHLNIKSKMKLMDK